MASYRPSEVVRITGLSLSSVKNHCRTYARYLSPGASQVGQTRYFTPMIARAGVRCPTFAPRSTPVRDSSQAGCWRAGVIRLHPAQDAPQQATGPPETLHRDKWQWY